MNDHDFFSGVGKTLLSYKLITPEQHAEVDTLVREKGLSFEHALSQAAQIDVQTYRKVLEEVSGCVAVDPSQIAIDPDFIESILEVLPLSVIVSLKVFPVSVMGNQLTLSMPNPADTDLITELESTTSMRVKPVVTTYRGVQQAIEQN